MFTGIIEEIGKISHISRGAKSSVLTIQCKTVLKNTKVGDSIAVNGVCLTVTSMTSGSFQADVMAETMNRSMLGSLKNGDKVNLERAMEAGGRFGGHIVSGHIDGCGTVVSLVPEDNAVWITIKASKNILKYVIEKGSITMDGISLTVAYVDDNVFKVSVIPHTGGHTTLLQKRPGELINLENDLIGKYVDKLMHWNKGEEIEIENKNEKQKENKNENKNEMKKGITIDFLSQNGFC